MNHLRRTKSHIWNFSFFKVRRRTDPNHPRIPRTPSDDHKSVSSDVWVDAIEDQRDGFYRYSEFNEESLEGPLADIMRQNDNLDENSEFYLSSSLERHSRPYRVSSGEWVTAVTSSSLSPSQTYGASRVTSQVLSLDDLTELEIPSHFVVVLKIFSQIYAIAKLAQIAFMGFGIELDNSETGLRYWIDRAEANIATDCLGELITIVEHLFYVVYARIKLEMAGIELCALYKMETRPAMTKDRQFYMPEPNHLYRIFLLFKDILDSPGICEERDNDVISRFMENYVRMLICKDARLGPFCIDDILGYRRYAYSIVNNRHSTYCKKWDSLISIFPGFPPETMTVLSERYFAMTPKQVPDCDIPTNQLPFTNLELIDPVLREQGIILDHRIGTLAKLEGKSIGDCRREDGKICLLHEVKHSKCICKSACFCARKCTYNVERPCPCAERQLRMQLALTRKDVGLFEFSDRVNTIALAGFQGLAALKGDAPEDAIAGELIDIFEVISTEIHKERLTGNVVKWI